MIVPDAVPKVTLGDEAFWPCGRIGRVTDRHACLPRILATLTVAAFVAVGSPAYCQEILGVAGLDLDALTLRPSGSCIAIDGSNIVVEPGSTSITTLGTVTVRACAGALAGYVSIKVDGTTYKLAVYTP
jgi:hypothetical protein